MIADIYQVDSFTTEPFTGNPAGVCITEEEISEAAMQCIAMEMAVSETAFFSLKNRKLRWFTPKTEVSLCGHATLATAWVLYQKGMIKENETIRFNTVSGKLPVNIREDIVEMAFPLIKTLEKPSMDTEKINLLGINRNDIVFYGNAGEKDFIEVKNEKTVKEIKPDFAGLSNIAGRGVIVTSETTDLRCDFVSRYFAPWVGVNEDPVTGSAHCALADYWSKKRDRSKMTGFQASQRGGYVNVELLEDCKVKLSGNAIITIEGKMRLPSVY